MSKLIQYVREQVYSLLFFVYQNRQYVPAICFFASCINFVSYGIRFRECRAKDIPVSKFEFGDTYLKIYTHIMQYFDSSAIWLLLITACSFAECWGRKSTYPLIYLWSMWVIVHLDISFEPKHDFMFYNFLLLFQITFVFLTVKSLTNRNVK